jgi:hypothetical protein
LKTLFTVLFISISSFLFAQQSYVTCNEIHYKQYTDVLSYPAAKCMEDLYSTKNFNEIPAKDTALIRGIKRQIASRAGADFYSHLDLRSIIRSRVSASCNFIKYTFLYYFKIDSTFDYRFTLAYDEDGNLVGDPAFPSILQQPGFYKLAPICNSLESLAADSMFSNFYPKFRMEKIKTIQLEYDMQLKNFVYKVYGVTRYNGTFGFNGYAIGWWYGKIIVANAQTGEKIRVEDYKERKSVFFK